MKHAALMHHKLRMHSSKLHQRTDFKMSHFTLLHCGVQLLFTNFRLKQTALVARPSTLAPISLQCLRVSLTHWALINLLGLNCRYKLQTDDNYREEFVLMFKPLISLNNNRLEVWRLTVCPQKLLKDFQWPWTFNLNYLKCNQGGFVKGNLTESHM